MTDRGMTDRQHEVMARIMADRPAMMSRLGRADRSAKPKDETGKKHCANDALTPRNSVHFRDFLAPKPQPDRRHLRQFGHKGVTRTAHGEDVMGSQLLSR
jgi:hypothetical protein